MNDAPRFWAVVPAAGSGVRFDKELPKQFFPLKNRPLAQTTLQRLLLVPQIERLVVPCDLGSMSWTQVEAIVDSRVQRVAGGEQRAHSVLNGLDALADVAGENDWVLVHDMARPCITLGDINKLIRELEPLQSGGLLVARVSDTLKRVSAEGVVESTLNRDQCRTALTPQMFRFGLLRRAIGECVASGLNPTDEAAAVEAIGESVHVVEGRRDNIKVTRREDLVIAEAILAYQEREACA